MFKGEACSLKEFGEKSFPRALIILKFTFLQYSPKEPLVTRAQMRSPVPGGCRRSWREHEEIRPNNTSTLGRSTPSLRFSLSTPSREMNWVMKAGPGRALDPGAAASGTRAPRAGPSPLPGFLLCLVCIHSSHALPLTSGAAVSAGHSWASSTHHSG